MKPNEKENSGVGVRVGATPEPLTLPPELKAALEWYRDEALALAINLEAERTMAVTASVQVLALDAGNRGITALALLERWGAALRAPEPLTAEPIAAMNAALSAYMDEADKHGRQVSGTDFGAGFRAALEGGVSRTEPALTEPTDEMIREGIRAFQNGSDGFSDFADWRAFYCTIRALVAAKGQS